MKEKDEFIGKKCRIFYNDTSEHVTSIYGKITWYNESQAKVIEPGHKYPTLVNSVVRMVIANE